MNRSPLHRAARRYAKAGRRVHPLKPGGKEPLTPHGFKDATTDLAQIDEWWQRWPDANIGMLTEGLIVLDSDPRNGGPATREDFERQFGKLPIGTVVQHTGGGGLHFVFARNGCKPPSKLAPGVDIKSDGGYIVVAPSVHPSGKSYEWE